MKDCCLLSKKSNGKFCSTCGENIEDMDLVCNVAIIGDGGVGKSMISCQYIKRAFDDNWDPTIQDSYNRKDIVHSKVVLVKLIDTSGQEEFTSLLPDVIRASEAIILVYDITSKITFLRATQNLWEKIRTIKEKEHWSGILVGNKSDCDDRMVTKKEGQEFAKQHGLLFMETSAKKRENIDEVFRDVIARQFHLDDTKGPSVNKKKGYFSSVSNPDDLLDIKLK
jgi:small GTP-binding protein